MALRIPWKSVLRHLRPNALSKLSYSGVRTLLSDAYTCNEAWSQRLQTSILQKVDVANFAIRLQDKMDKEGEAPAIDFDILANKMEQLDLLQLDFAENLFHRFRSTTKTLDTTESMSYAVIRGLLKKGETERLLRMLKDKHHYGIFLNDFTANMCMDHFIRNQQYLEACQIAIDLMLQEDFGSNLTKHLAWYSCHLAWKNCPLEELEPEPVVEEDDGEEKLVKVKFIHNPWYDDHWDLPTDGRGLGKTLVLLTNGQSDHLSDSYRLVGWGFWQKFSEGLLQLEEMTEKKQGKIAQEALDSFNSCLENVVTKETPEEKKDPGLVRLEDVMPYVTSEQKLELTDRLKAVQEKLEGQGQVDTLDLGAELKVKVEAAVAEQESMDIEKQTSLFKEWDELREAEVQRSLDAIRLHQQKIDIAERLQKLTEMEEKLRYFEQEQKVSLGISRMPRERPIDEVKEEEQFVPPPQERGKMF